MSTDTAPAQTMHAGRLIARRLKASGIDTVFTLSGGHLFSIYDGCREEGIRLIDTRHEQTAAFAARGAGASGAKEKTCHMGESLTHESAVPNNSVPVRRISALAAIQAVRRAGDITTPNVFRWLSQTVERRCFCTERRIF